MDPCHSFRMDLDLQQVPVLSLDQIRAIRANNDYMERAVALEPNTQSGFFYAHDEHFLHGVYIHHPQPSLHSVLPRSQSQQQHVHLTHLSRSSTISSSMSRTSATSDQRLLAGLTPSHSGLSSVVRSQPKGELKHDISLEKGLVENETEVGLHLFICERCGRCKCQECCTPRHLPSCWICGQRCLCSAESAVEYGTCLCCVKGLFYHCSAQDDEDNCADRPCSCTPAHACARWGTMGLLAFSLPCLCCYPPARLCLSLCQCAHDRATRPGCRCSDTNTVCRKISTSNPNPGPPSLRSKALEKPL
ncbi:LOW QUALITY PROTEIN: protein sprouty homolog 3 [Thalassophryne amazonica]|uniref:LOW QUALITY PROTEIN: protein sprouty homolog 3 n=1 Tax=Thalassophryne amazonica TaxID=390379 RepID=UPI00147111CE|nr:LOW QUALITY PROTEIN: protein sprouty homolog 3 [Thalassophryne amazonica]